MRTRIISASDLTALVDAVGLDALTDELIEALRDACLNHDPSETEVRARDGFHYDKPRPGLIEWMPVLRRGSTATIKTVAYHPTNPQWAGLPTIVGSIGLYDATTGCLLGLCDGTLPTTLRTAAASALATQVLARPDSRVLGFIGAGTQAVAHLHALLRILRPDAVLVSDANPINARSFSRRTANVRPRGLRIRVVSVPEILESADVLTTATSIGVGEGPLFEDTGATKAWLHVNAVGSDFRGKTELPRPFLERALVFPDHPDQCIAEGECQQLESRQIGPSLAEVVRSADEWRSAQARTTVFDSTGWAVEDQVVMSQIMRHATRLGLGAQALLHHFSSDPLNPFESLRVSETGRSAVVR